MKGKRQLVSLGLAAVILAAPAFAQDGPVVLGTELPPLIVSRDGRMPEGDAEATAEVGETMYAEYRELLQRAIVIDAHFEVRKYHFGPGSILYGYLGRNGSLHWCSEDVEIRSMGANWGPFCLIDTDSDGSIEKRNTSGAATLGVDTPEYHEELLVPSSRLNPDLPGDAFRIEVLYQGVGSGALRLLYREYAGDLARPAFSQDLTFDLDEDGPTLVAVKGSRIEVLEAGNLGVRYRVLKAFDN